jgi:hypothetical protein
MAEDYSRFHPVGRLKLIGIPFLWGGSIEKLALCVKPKGVTTYGGLTDMSNDN